jgi:hypothetical protein
MVTKRDLPITFEFLGVPFCIRELSVSIITANPWILEVSLSWRELGVSSENSEDDPFVVV